MKRALLLTLAATTCFAQATVPDGTKIRLALDQTLSSATADEGQAVELIVTENVKLDGVTVIQEGARATGTIVLAREKRRMGRAGKLDFSVDRVRAIDGEWIPLRYSLNKKSGESKGTSTGIITAGVAVVFWPAAPFVLLRRGKDITINKGVTFDVFTDRNHEIAAAPSAGIVPAEQTRARAVPVHAQAAAPAPASFQTAFQPAVSQPASPVETATVTINASDPGADIEINGAFVGNAPTTLKLHPGQYNIAVRKGSRAWQRVVQVNAGSVVTLQASLSAAPR